MSILTPMMLLFSCGTKHKTDVLVPSKDSHKDIHKLGTQQVQSNAMIEVKRPFSWKEVDLKKIKYKLNQYIVTAHLPEKALSGEALKCSLFNNNGVKNIESKFEKDTDETFLFLDMKEDLSLEKASLVCVIEDSHSKKLTEFKKDIYKDYVVKEGRTDIKQSIFALANSFHVGIILFDKNSRFDISNRSLEINAEGIIFEDATVESYVLYRSTASAPRAGHDGGIFKLKTDYLYGNVQFELNGETAGNYDSKSNQKPAKQGHTGGAGCSYRSLTPPVGGWPQVVPNQKSAMKAGGCDCLAGSGGKGQDGKNGRKGFKGGNTGLYQIEVRIHSDIHISDVGIPGKGGRGEFGQPGGFGGYPGIGAKTNEQLRNIASMDNDLFRWYAKNNSSVSCRKYKAVRGPRGKDGLDGAYGASGQKRKSFFKKESVK